MPLKSGSTILIALPFLYKANLLWSKLEFWSLSIEAPALNTYFPTTPGVNLLEAKTLPLSYSSVSKVNFVYVSFDKDKSPLK